MTDKPQPDKFDWATELSDAQEHVTLSKQEAKEIGARLRSMGAKLKTYEDLGGAADDVQLLRMGYAAARLEIESLKAQSAGAMHGEHAELRRLSDCCPELNLSNYGPDDVDDLNGWAIEVSQCIDRALASTTAQPGADERRLRRILCARYEFLPYMDDGEAQGQKLDWLRCTVDQIEARILEVNHERFLASAAAPAGATLPEGWVPLVITHEGQYPEEVAYGPQRMMYRLGKWLRKYFDFVAAAKEQPEPAADLQEDQTQPWYDLAWKHGARRHASFDGDELTELSFRPAQFDAFCAELAPAAGAVAPAAVAGPSDAEPLHITHGPLMRHAAYLLCSSKPALPEHESVAAELELAADGHPTPAGEPSPEWLEVAEAAMLAAAPTTQPAPQQEALAAGGDSFLLLPTRPTPAAPANTAGLSWDAYSGAQMLAYGRLCSDAALLVAREGGVA